MPAVTTRRRAPAPPHSARSRRGATLVELVVSSALALLVAGAVATTVRRQSQLYSGLAALVAAREQLGGALALLRADLRGASPGGGDVTALAPDSIQLRVALGGGVACAGPDGLSLHFPPHGATGAPALAGWRATPRPGDSAAVYDPGDSTRPARWTLHAVAAFDTAPAPCDAPGAPVGAGAPGARFTLRLDAATPLPPHASAGTAVRLLRHVRYKLYRAGDGGWYLGFSDYRSPGGWAGMQPVSGPYDRADAASAPPPFRFYDARGAEVGPAQREAVARVTVVLATRAARGEPAARDSIGVAVRGPDE